MDFEFLKQYFLWDLVIFICLVTLVLLGWGVYKLIRRKNFSKKIRNSKDEELLHRIEQVLDIKKVEDGIMVYGDVIINPKK